MSTVEELEQKYDLLFPHLNERQQHLVAAIDAEKLGRGGIALVARVAGLSRPTLYRAMQSLHQPPLPMERIRHPGAGRKELVEQVGTSLAAFCGGVGTAGMIVGVSRALKDAGCKTRIVALEPASSPVLTTGKGGPHRVEGIAAGFRPPHLKDGEYDEVRTVEEGAAREMARRLAKEEGIFAGTSSGLNVTAALQLAQEMGRGSTIATVAVDTGFKYLAGDLYRE